MTLVAVRYLGVVESDKGSAFGMWFPDMPGCFPAADELSDLPQVAAEILRQHVEALESNGRSVPPPRPLSEVVGDCDVRDAVAQRSRMMLVPLLKG